MGFRVETVSSFVKRVASYNKARHGISIYNKGSIVVYISDNPADITRKGYPLAGGMTLQLVEAEGDEPAYALYAQTVDGTSELRIYEGVRE